MARVLVASQPWGVLWERNASSRLLSVPDAESIEAMVVSIDATVYTTEGGATEVAAEAFRPSSFGALPGWVEEGDWTLTVDGVEFPAAALGGTLPARVDAAAAAGGGAGSAVVAEAAARAAADSLLAPKASPTFTGTVSGVTKAHVGLGSVDNTSDAAKPVSTAQDARFLAVESSNLGKAAKATLPINVTDYGVLPGLGDQSAGWATVVAKLNTDQGGTVFFPRSTLPYRIDTFTIPYDGASTEPKQYPMRITGEGGWASGRQTSPTGGTILDLGASTGPAKIDTRGIGLLMIDHMTFREPSAGTTTPFVQTTNTSLHVTHCGFIGHSSKAMTACDQDAILLGGGSNINPGGIGGSNASDAAFQGYGTVIKDNAFHRIRRGVYGQRWCNAVVIRDNWFMHTCGTNLAGGAAIELQGFSPDACSGNFITGNSIEMLGYPYGVKMGVAVQNELGPNGFYDPGDGTGGKATTLAYYRFETDGFYNQVIDGFRDDTKPLVSEAAAVVGKNSIITSHQNQESLFSGYLKAAELRSPRAVLDTTLGAGEKMLSFNQAATLRAHLSNYGRTWSAEGVGAEMKIDTGSGGSYLVLQGYGVKVRDYLGAITATIKVGIGSPEGVYALPVGSLFIRVDGGAGTVLYVKETGGSTVNGWVAK